MLFCHSTCYCGWFLSSCNFQLNGNSISEKNNRWPIWMRDFMMNAILFASVSGFHYIGALLYAYVIRLKLVRYDWKRYTCGWLFFTKFVQSFDLMNERYTCDHIHTIIYCTQCRTKDVFDVSFLLFSLRNQFLLLTFIVE